MIQIRNKLFIVLVIGQIFISCENKLAIPPIIYQDNTIVATINQTGYGNTIFKCQFTPGSVKFSGDSSVISGVDITGNGYPCPGGEVGILFSFHAKSAGIYLLSNYGYAFTSESGSCSLNTFSYFTDSSHTGTITLTVFDTVNHVLSGTFNFIAEGQQPLPNYGIETVTNGHITNLSW